jgi:hypothetical protein
LAIIFIIVDVEVVYYPLSSSAGRNAIQPTAITPINAVSQINFLRTAHIII